jgi:serine protease inhibitor
MTRQVFYSFHFERDSHRVAQVKKMGAIEGQPILTANKWEEVKKGGNKAIQKWIDEQMVGKSCAVVLIGSATADRRWVDYEIEKAWNTKKGLVGVHIHNLKDLAKKQSPKGSNPFAGFTFGTNKTKLNSVVKTYDPPSTVSTSVYDHISRNLAEWVEEAVKIRNKY